MTDIIVPIVELKTSLKMLNYKYYEETTETIRGVLNDFPLLHLSQGRKSDSIQELIFFNGDIELAYEGANRKVPLQIWLPTNFPKDRPQIFISPNQGDVLTKSTYIQQNGKIINMPHLEYWKPHYSIQNILNELIEKYFKIQFPIEHKHLPMNNTPFQSNMLSPDELSYCSVPQNQIFNYDRPMVCPTYPSKTLGLPPISVTLRHGNSEILLNQPHTNNTLTPFTYDAYYKWPSCPDLPSQYKQDTTVPAPLVPASPSIPRSSLDFFFKDVNRSPFISPTTVPTLMIDGNPFQKKDSDGLLLQKEKIQSLKKKGFTSIGWNITGDSENKPPSGQCDTCHTENIHTDEENKNSNSHSVTMTKTIADYSGSYTNRYPYHTEIPTMTNASSHPENIHADEDNIASKSHCVTMTIANYSGSDVKRYQQELYSIATPTFTTASPCPVRIERVLPVGNMSTLIATRNSTQEFFLDNYQDSYPMTSMPRGYACIINVGKIEGQLPRTGTNIDCENLRTLWSKLHFNVIVYNDSDGLSAEGILNKLKRFADHEGHKQSDCCIVCLLSHGKDEHIYGTDGELLPVNTILTLFDNNMCSKLRNKPKLFFIQACRGGSREKGILLNNQSEIQSDALAGSQNPNIPSTITDALIAYPTPKGYVSWRDKTKGSWFIQGVVNIFTEFAHKEDICSMMNRVNNWVSEMIDVAPDSHTAVQMSQYISILRKSKLFFFPGIFR